MKKYSIAIPGALSLANWLFTILGYVAIQSEWVKGDSADELQMVLLFYVPVLWVFTLAASVALLIAGHRSSWITFGIAGSAAGLLVIALVVVAFISAFSDLASFG